MLHHHRKKKHKRNICFEVASQWILYLPFRLNCCDQATTVSNMWQWPQLIQSVALLGYRCWTFTVLFTVMIFSSRQLQSHLFCHSFLIDSDHMLSASEGLLMNKLLLDFWLCKTRWLLEKRWKAGICELFPSQPSSLLGWTPGLSLQPRLPANQTVNNSPPSGGINCNKLSAYTSHWCRHMTKHLRIFKFVQVSTIYIFLKALFIIMCRLSDF